MVKVVGRDDSAVKRVTCRSCASILEYTLAEVKSQRGMDYGGYSSGSESVVCPNCGQQVIIRSW